MHTLLLANMVEEPIYLDLSSSSDDDDEESNRDRDGPTALLCLSKVFNMDVDDDDVRIIDKPASDGKVKRNRARVVRSKLDDDDCCILDTEPDAADAVPDAVSSHDTDELVMTGEKGPVACRDFPHARYLCVHFPFKSTLHSNYCAQCHCYVCDSLAPCSLWGEGNNPKDHCHASEEPSWKSLRKIAKYRSFSSIAAPTTRSADPTEESRLVQTSLSQTLPSCALPITPVTPVESPGVVPRIPTTGKRDPLVIQLKGKGRGKVSQPLQLLGVKNARCKTNLKKSAPGCLVPRSTSPPPFGRAEDEPPLTTPNPTYRLRRSRGRVPSIITPDPEPPLTTPRPGRPVPATTPSHSQPPHTTPNHNFRPGRAGGGISPNKSALPPSPLDTPNPNFRLGRAGGPVPTTRPNPNSRLGRAVSSTTTPHSRSMRSSNSLPNRAVAASPSHQGRNTVSSRAGGVATTESTVQQLPQPTLSPNSAPDAATSNIPPPVTVNDLQAPSVSAGPQRYVSAGPLRDQQVSDVSIDPLSEGHSRSAQSHWPSVVPGFDFSAHDSRTAVDNATSSHGGVTVVDVLAGPIEGWDMDFNSLTPEHVPTSLNDVIQQMAADDALWEQPYPGWQ